MYLNKDIHLCVTTDSASTLKIVVNYKDVDAKGRVMARGSQVTSRVVTSGYATLSAILDAPTNGCTRLIEDLQIGEGANAAEIVNLFLATLSGTTYTATSLLFKADLAAYARLAWTPDSGFTSYNATGSLFLQVAT